MDIVVDAFGGDNAPSEIIKGCIQAANEYDVHIILTGDENKIKEAAEKEASKKNVEVMPIIILDNLKDAVEYARNNAIKGDIVAMSPASASFDLYKNFEVRGNYFKDLVNKLK